MGERVEEIYKRIDKIMPYVPYYLAFVFIVAIFIIPFMWYHITFQLSAGCEVNKATLYNIEYQQNWTEWDLRAGAGSAKFLYTNESTISFNYPYRVEQFRKEYEMPANYILTYCNETLRGISKDDFWQDRFYYRLKAKV